MQSKQHAAVHSRIVVATIAFVDFMTLCQI